MTRNWRASSTTPTTSLHVDLLPNRNAADDDVVLAITWLELMARLGFLKKNDNWCKLYDMPLS